MSLRRVTTFYPNSRLPGTLVFLDCGHSFSSDSMLWVIGKKVECVQCGKEPEVVFDYDDLRLDLMYTKEDREWLAEMKITVPGQGEHAEG